MNETKFCVRCNKAHIIITLKHIYSLMFTNVDNHDYLIMIKYINVINYVLSSFLIMIAAYI